MGVAFLFFFFSSVDFPDAVPVDVFLGVVVGVVEEGPFFFPFNFDLSSKISISISSASGKSPCAPWDSTTFSSSYSGFSVSSPSISGASGVLGLVPDKKLEIIFDASWTVS